MCALATVALGVLNCAAVQAWTADNGNGTYSNPLFYDELADPDVIRVGADFYLVGSSMHAMPGLALLHSRDLVNWNFESYALDKLDLGPEYRLEEGKYIYGEGIWAPCLRYHNGVFYIFANVNHQSTQVFRSASPRGPWNRTPMQRSFHDLSVLFDDDGKIYVVWGYREIHIAQLNAELTDVVPNTERILIDKEAGMGEGLHLYKFNHQYFLTSAWYLDTMRLPVARASQLSGSWEVNQNINRGEQFGKALGWRLSTFRPPLTTTPPYTISPPDVNSNGRMALHQGGIVDTPSGEWWGITMGEENAIGRTTALSPITWQDGWPYFGLTGNLGRTPRTWVKPKIHESVKPHVPYSHNDNFSTAQLQPVWQWNHVPVDASWSLTERAGFLRLHALPADTLWDARNTLTQRAVGPRSIPTVVVESAGLKSGDVAGLALLIQPDAWIGIEKHESGFSVIQHNGQTMHDEHVPIAESRVWLRVDCDYLTQLARFSYRADGKVFHDIGEPFRMVFIGVPFQGVRYSLFNFHRSGGEAGFADFDSIEVREPSPRAFTRSIPYGSTIVLQTHGHEPIAQVSEHGAINAMQAIADAEFNVVDQRLGRVALRGRNGFLTVSNDGHVSVSASATEAAKSFQWIETFTGELTLLSLQTHRYLRVNISDGTLHADSAGPEPAGTDDIRFDWQVITASKNNH